MSPRLRCWLLPEKWLSLLRSQHLARAARLYRIAYSRPVLGSMPLWDKPAKAAIRCFSRCPDGGSLTMSLISKVFERFDHQIEYLKGYKFGSLLKG